MIVVDEAQLPTLPGAIEMYRAALALMGGDIAGTVDHARRVLALAPDDDEMGRAAAHALLGLAAWSEGDLDTAFAEYTESIAAMRRAGHIADILGCSIAMADIRVAQGRLRDAQRLYEQGLQLVADHGDRSVARHRRHARRPGGDPARARRPRGRGGRAASARRSSSCSGRGSIPTAREQCAPGCGWRRATRPAASRCWTRPSGSTTPTSPPRCARSAPAGRACYVLQGDLNAARAWVRERNLSTDDELRYVTEFEHITLAIILVNDAPGERELQQVSAMLDRLAGRGRSRWPRQQRDRDPRGAGARLRRAWRHGRARSTRLRRAVALAEPEGYVRVFDYLGPRLHALRDALATGSVRPARTQQPGLVDPLSDRELDVLRLLRSELSGPDIARELMVSLNTMRTHTKSIYTKLGVNNRREAVAPGRRAGSLAPTRITTSITTCGDVGSPHRFVRCVRAVRDPSQGHLDSRWAAWFDGLSLTREDDGTTVIHGPIVDQAALHGLLQKLRDIGVPLISLTQLRPEGE